ncbi:hypothetical protein PMAYCL1PPCAC_26619, partial [Pristionchus mayeri]
KCKQYLIVTVAGADQVEIEFRDDKFDKDNGAVFKTGSGSPLFSCKNNKISSPLLSLLFSDMFHSQHDKVYCKFSMRYNPSDQEKEIPMGTFLKDKEA